ncbi:trihelix transcription factor GT-2-like [Dorcoceras hygrometricum]|uniref:Trihelix transcription factor GT-2-like n=1 Tax=Dorcoceras hygrometricum TaxID=472368 RepID=A0A2Z7D719_9LAMI|nr:trihelix transcription factor GT-2-like [Dorcoceras hygrometricum]
MSDQCQGETIISAEEIEPAGAFSNGNQQTATVLFLNQQVHDLRRKFSSCKNPASKDNSSGVEKRIQQEERKKKSTAGKHESAVAMKRKFSSCAKLFSAVKQEMKQQRM